MKKPTAIFLKGLGSLGTGVLLAGIFAPAAGTTTLGVFVVAMGYAMLMLAAIGNVMDVRARYPASPGKVALFKAIFSVMAHLCAACFVTALGQLLVALSAPVAVLVLIDIASLFLLSMMMGIVSVAAFIAYRHYRE